MVRSLYSGVSGLKAHQVRMDVIGNNIANVNTYGYKAYRTAFSDIYYQYQRRETEGNVTFAGNNPSQVGYGVQVASIDKNMEASNLQLTNRNLDLALPDDGMFITATLDRNGAISGVRYTRMGNFLIDSVGNLANANNEFVLGRINSPRKDGGTYSSSEILDKNPGSTPAEMDVINVNDLIWDAFKPDCELDFDDVDKKYKETDETAGTVQTIFSMTDPYNEDRLIAYAQVQGAAPTADAFGAMTDYEVPEDTTDTIRVATDFILYNVDGKYMNVQGVEYDPDMGYFVDKDKNYYTFDATTSRDANGELVKTYTYTKVEIPEDGAALSGTATAEVYTYDEGSDSYQRTDDRGNTIYADMTDSSLKYADLTNFSVGVDGVLKAQYADRILSLARIDVATFDNIEGLSAAGETAFLETSSSGAPKIKRPGDSGASGVESGKLEMSNVNLADEFSDMIVTQRGYQANARIITTSDSMLEELVNLKR